MFKDVTNPWSTSTRFTFCPMVHPSTSLRLLFLFLWQNTEQKQLKELGFFCFGSQHKSTVHHGGVGVSVEVWDWRWQSHWMSCWDAEGGRLEHSLLYSFQLFWHSHLWDGASIKGVFLASIYWKLLVWKLTDMLRYYCPGWFWVLLS